MTQAPTVQSDLASLFLDRLLNIVRADARDLNLRQLAVLLICQSTDEPQTIRGLAEQLRIFKPSVTRAVDRLEAAELVKRKADPADKRSVLVTITPAGRKYCAKFAGQTR